MRQSLQRYLAGKDVALQHLDNSTLTNGHTRTINRRHCSKNRPLLLCYNMFDNAYFVHKRDFFALSSTKIFYFPLDFISLRPGILPTVVVTGSDSAWIGSKRE